MEESGSWSFGSLLSSLHDSLPSPFSIISGARALVPSVSFTSADGSPRYGLIALTAGAAAGAGYFILRSSFGGNHHYPYHLLAGSDRSENRLPAGGAADQQDADPISGQQEVTPVGVEEHPPPRQAETSSLSSSVSGGDSRDNGTNLVFAAWMLILVLVSVTISYLLHNESLAEAIIFWKWHKHFPLFFPIFFTAAGLLLGKHLNQLLPQTQQKLKPLDQVTKLSTSGGESKHAIEEEMVCVEASKTPEGVLEEKSHKTDLVATASVDDDALASLDAIWEKSEKGVVTKTEVLNAVMIKIGQDPGSLAALDGQITDSVEYLWRTARALSNIASWDPSEDPQEKKKHVNRGIDYAKLAVAQLQNSPCSQICQANAYKFLAILQGQSTAYLGVKEGMVLANEIRKNMETALEKNPRDPMLHYMIGVWKYNVAEVPYAVRYGASWISGVLLEANFDSALIDIEKALELGGEEFYIDFHVMHAKLKLKIGGPKSKELAISSLEKALALDVVSPGDIQIKEKAERLLSKIK
eukprot:g296.t1